MHNAINLTYPTGDTESIRDSIVKAVTRRFEQRNNLPGSGVLDSWQCVALHMLAAPEAPSYLVVFGRQQRSY